jgi:putative spermidine/putrescine transport system substrate-binding protein
MEEIAAAGLDETLLCSVVDHRPRHNRRGGRHLVDDTAATADHGDYLARHVRPSAGKRDVSSYGESQRVDVRIANYDGGLDHVRQEVATRKYDWDVVDFELADAIRACHEGILAPVDLLSLPSGSDGTVAPSDFVPHALGPCWVGSVVYAQVIAYSPSRFGEKTPRSARDFFDVAQFPGPRAIRRASAKFNLELALLADGVRPGDVYPTLSTPAGVTRALKKLSTIRQALVWWDRPDEPLKMLAEGRASMATALNGNVFDAQTHGQNVEVVWDRELYELDVFGIPKGDSRADRALAFIRFATGTESLARVAAWVPYGPARRSAQSGVGHNPDLGIAMAPYLPTEPEHFATAFAIDDDWWGKHGGDIAALWQAWLDHGG